MADLILTTQNELQNLIEVSLKKVLSAERSNHSTPEQPQEEFLTIEQAAEFLKLTVPTLYSKTSKGELPAMKRGKRLYFSRLELVQYLKDGRRKTNTELSAIADNYIKR